MLHVVTFIPYCCLLLCVIQEIVLSEWTVEINQYNVTMPLRMASQWVMTLLEMPIVISQWVMLLLRTSILDLTKINNVVIYGSQGITMHNAIDMNIFYYVFSALCLIMLFYYG